VRAAFSLSEKRDGVPEMSLDHTARHRAAGNVAYSGIEADVLRSDALPGVMTTWYMI
jgi:hypothetical protein